MRTRHRSAKKSSLKQSLTKVLPGKAPVKKTKHPKPAAKPVEETASGPAINYESRETLPRPAKLLELERQLKVTRTSTASLGKYDNKLTGEKAKEKGARKQYDNNELDSKTEHERYMNALESLGDEDKIKRRKAGVDENADVVNVRKAIRSESKGRGSASLAGSEKRGSARGRGRGRGSTSRSSFTNDKRK